MAHMSQEAIEMHAKKMAERKAEKEVGTKNTFFLIITVESVQCDH
jgi:hypothetical protein